MKKIAIVGALCLVALFAVLVFAPVASAGMVTKIMYAQENVETFAYTPAANGSLWVQIAWVDHLGNATSFPISECDGAITGPQGGDLYVDYDVASLYAGTNPVTGTVPVTSGKTCHISIYPYVDDCVAAVQMRLGGSGGTHITATRMSDGATVTSPQTVNCYASDGEIFVPSDGDWVSMFQTWPGTAAEYYACWNEHVYSGSGDILADPPDVPGVPRPFRCGIEQPTRKILSGTIPPRSARWYAVTPQIWPAASVPNATDAGGNSKPGAITVVKAPAVYTYAYPDSTVTGMKPAYSWGFTTSASASKRNYSATVSMGASLRARFSGNSITWVYTKGKGYGRANVSIDGGAATVVSQYNAGGFLFQQSTTFSGLGAGNHEIVITNAGKDPAGSTNTTISHDCFLAKGINDASDPTPWMENNYDGQTSYSWGATTSASASGGSYAACVAVGASFAVEFKGTAVQWVYTKGRGYGRARVFIDGVDEGLVSQFNAAGFAYQQSTTFSGLDDTTHIMWVKNEGKDPAGSTNTSLSHDAIVVAGSGAGTFEN